MSSPYRIVIPARYGSTRFPGKALVPLAGKPMIQWVHERCRGTRASEILVATDDERIRRVAEGFGAKVVMTAASHASGTDRIAEVARVAGWPLEALVVNVQGDEPLIPPALIDQVAERLAQDTHGASIATLASTCRALEEFLDPNVVKVVIDDRGHALYFSRAPIPWNRDGAKQGFNSQRRFDGARRHLGIYAYRVGALLQLAAAPVAPLEDLEKLEQLRALSIGLRIAVADARERPGADVNTPEDVAIAESLLRGTE